jgi:hypothetical protein
MLLTLFLITALTLATIFVHLEGLWFVRRIPARLRERPRLALTTVVILALWLHVIEIAAYGAVYFLADRYLNIGRFAGDKGFDVLEYFYFSAETFTALGYGDVTPSGFLRLIAVAEPLNGLLLISWSGAYTFIAMQRLWTDRSSLRRAARACKSASSTRTQRVALAAAKPVPRA